MFEFELFKSNAKRKQAVPLWIELERVAKSFLLERERERERAEA
jgi:hypothetical protein